MATKPYEVHELEQQAKAITSKILEAQDVKISRQQLKIQNKRTRKQIKHPVAQTQHQQPYGQQPRISNSAASKLSVTQPRQHPLSEMK